MRLESERIYLRPLCELDAPIILENTMDKEIRYMTGTNSNFSLVQIKTHIENINNDSSRYDFAICLKGTDKMIGELSIFDIDEANKKSRIQNIDGFYFINRKGYVLKLQKLF